MHSIASARIPQWRRLNRFKELYLEAFLHLKGQQILMRRILSVFIGWIDPRPSSSLIVDMRRNSASVLAVFFILLFFFRYRF